MVDVDDDEIVVCCAALTIYQDPKDNIRCGWAKRYLRDIWQYGVLTACYPNYDAVLCGIRLKKCCNEINVLFYKTDLVDRYKEHMSPLSREFSTA